MPYKPFKKKCDDVAAHYGLGGCEELKEYFHYMLHPPHAEEKLKKLVEILGNPEIMRLYDHIRDEGVPREAVLTLIEENIDLELSVGENVSRIVEALNKYLLSVKSKLEREANVIYMMYESEIQKLRKEKERLEKQLEKLKRELEKYKKKPPPPPPPKPPVKEVKVPVPVAAPKGARDLAELLSRIEGVYRVDLYPARRELRITGRPGVEKRVEEIVGSRNIIEIKYSPKEKPRFVIVTARIPEYIPVAIAVKAEMEEIPPLRGIKPVKLSELFTVEAKKKYSPLWEEFTSRFPRLLKVYEEMKATGNLDEFIKMMESYIWYPGTNELYHVEYTYDTRTRKWRPRLTPVTERTIERRVKEKFKVEIKVPEVKPEEKPAKPPAPMPWPVGRLYGPGFPAPAAPAIPLDLIPEELRPLFRYLAVSGMLRNLTYGMGKAGQYAIWNIETMLEVMGLAERVYDPKTGEYKVVLKKGVTPELIQKRFYEVYGVRVPYEFALKIYEEYSKK